MNHQLEMFKNEPGFHKLFVKFKEKYRSLGRIGGSVKIADFTEGEFAAIAGFFAMSPNELSARPTVSLAKFEDQLQKTNMAGLTLKQLLESYFKESLISKAETQLRLAEEEKVFYGRLSDDYPGLSWWFKRILERKPDTRFIHILYKQDKQNLERMLQAVAEAFQHLPQPGQYERLPLFAQRTTGNPHSFDRNQTMGKLLLHLLAFHQQQKENQEPVPFKQAEQINELLFQYGILRDDLWNFVTCRGFIAYQNEGVHPVWQAAAANRTVMNIPIRELTAIEWIKPSKGRTVWVLENSGVCSAIMDQVPDAPIVCTHGQFKAASWLFFDRLVDSGCRIYYAGDLDPEGLLMAQRLKNRYPENIKIWRMDKESYLSALSEEKIEERTSQLKNLEDPDLKMTAELMLKHGFAAYQEGLVEWLIADIQNTSV